LVPQVIGHRQEITREDILNGKVVTELGQFQRSNTGGSFSKEGKVKILMEYLVEHDQKWRLSMAVDRESCRPAVRIRQDPNDAKLPDPLYERGFQQTFGFSLTTGISESFVTDISETFHLPQSSSKSLGKILRGLFKIFDDGEAISLEVDLLYLPDGQFMCSNSLFWFDDAARDRQHAIHDLRAKEQEAEQELYAEEHGLVYIKMQGSVGTVVNGAGLASATNDTISLYGGSSANFLDAGGQATKETMLQAFKIIIADQDVKSILVNIFGGKYDFFDDSTGTNRWIGITRCDMIAESIIAAAKELGPFRVPLVARLQGTNSEAGLKMVSVEACLLAIADKCLARRCGSWN
jgi:succinyl-CoA synthetase beta subunit